MFLGYAAEKQQERGHCKRCGDGHHTDQLPRLHFPQSVIAVTFPINQLPWLRFPLISYCGYVSHQLVTMVTFSTNQLLRYAICHHKYIGSKNMGLLIYKKWNSRKIRKITRTIGPIAADPKDIELLLKVLPPQTESSVQVHTSKLSTWLSEQASPWWSFITNEILEKPDSNLWLGFRTAAVSGR